MAIKWVNPPFSAPIYHIFHYILLVTSCYIPIILPLYHHVSEEIWIQEAAFPTHSKDVCGSRIGLIRQMFAGGPLKAARTQPHRSEGNGPVMRISWGCGLWDPYTVYRTSKKMNDPRSHWIALRDKSCRTPMFFCPKKSCLQPILGMYQGDGNSCSQPPTATKTARAFPSNDSEQKGQERLVDWARLGQFHGALFCCTA